MVNTNFASTIYDPVRGLDGPVSWLSYAFRFMQLPLGLFGVAMASATLPSISRSAARGEHGRVPANAVEIAGHGVSADRAVVGGPDRAGQIDHRRDLPGRPFQLYDTQQTALALSCYAIGLAGYAALKVLNPAFYALGDARTPMLVSLGSIVVNFAAAESDDPLAGLGHAGLALSTSAVALFGFVVLFAILRRADRRSARARTGVGQIGKVTRGVVRSWARRLALPVTAWRRWLGVSQLARLADLAVSLPVGLAVFYVVCRALSVSELDLAIRAAVAPIRRRLSTVRP